MTLDDLLLEWSYRSEKGYPSMDNPSDISILKQILEKLNLPSNIIIENLTEAAFSGKTLTKRGNDIKFLSKIDKKEEFEMIDGSMITIDPEQSSDAIQLIKNKEFEGNTKRLKFTDTSGKIHRLTLFKKTKEFGGGAGAGEYTRIMESAHCYALAIAYYIKQGPITEDDLLGADNSEQFAQAQQYVDVDAELDEVDGFFTLKGEEKDWYPSIVKATNKIYELFPNKGYKFHRNSNLVDTLYRIFKKSFEKEDEKSLQYNFMKDDKWNPADIWMINDNVDPEEFSGNLSVLNGQLADWYEDGDMIGISLKKIGKKNDAIEKIFNDPEIGSKKYNYEGYKTTATSKGVDILFTGGSATARMFGGTAGFAIEANGKVAQGGKAGGEAINFILNNNGLPPLPRYKETELAFKNNNEDYYNKLYYLFDRFIENISKEDFEEKYNSEPIEWKVGNFYGLEFIEKLEDNKNKANEIINDILRYAYSSTNDSSKFIKISE